MIPESIINKPKNLSNGEFSLVKEHPEYSYKLLENINFKNPIKNIIMQHHEKINGSGYPKGLNKNEILIETKIIAVADTINAMITKGPYREAKDLDKTLYEINKMKGKKDSKRVVDTCNYILKTHHIQSVMIRFIKMINRQYL